MRAQTYPQLFNQLRELEYSKPDLNFIRNAYEMAMVLFSGRFQPSGKLFIAHVVGTASILTSLRASPQVVSVGLLHNAYMAGDFGDGRQGLTEKRRQNIRQLLGSEVEQYLARFPAFSWSFSQTQMARHNPQGLDAPDRNLLLVCIADRLDHLYDLDLLYYDAEVRRSYLKEYHLAAEVAARLELGSIATEFSERLREIETVAVPVQFPKERIRGQAFVSVPESQKRRFAVKFQEQLIYHKKRLSNKTAQFRSDIDRIRFHTDELQSLLADGGRLERLASGFQFTEGPVWIAEEASLLFSDIPANVILRLKADRSVEIYRYPSRNSNGLTRDGNGRLVSCEHGSRCVARTERDGTITVLANKFGNRKLNSPNDVVLKSDGAVYFTDPAYGISPDQREQPFEGVYRVSPDNKEISLVASDFKRPNGLAFSPDEKFLYVADSERRHIRAFRVASDGSLSEGFVFHDMNVWTQGAPDGMKIDAEGRVFCTGAIGVWVLSPQGKRLGIIITPEKPSNCAWGDDDWRSLYITAGSSIYRIRVRTPGVRVA